MDLLLDFDLSPVEAFSAPLVDQMWMADLSHPTASKIEAMNLTLAGAREQLARAGVAVQPWLDELGMLDMMLEVGSVRSSTAFAPDYADLARLVSLVQRRRPGLVVEFGSGWSTFVLAKALADQGCGRLVSVEADAEWAELNRRCLPPSLKPHCEILHCPPMRSEHQGVPVFRHQGLPELAPDLVFLDGPALSPAVRAAADVLDMEARMPPGAVLVVDGRMENVCFLAQHLSRRWRVDARGLRYRGPDAVVADAIVHASVFELLPEG